MPPQDPRPTWGLLLCKDNSQGTGASGASAHPQPLLLKLSWASFPQICALSSALSTVVSPQLSQG